MSSFPDTSYTIVQQLRSDDADVRSRALDAVYRVYRAPVVSALRAKWPQLDNDAEDLAQEFFLQVLTKEWLSRYDRDKARFRTFLRSCLMAFAHDAHDYATRKKRGGDVHVVQLKEADGVPDDTDIHHAFEREWVRSVFNTAVERFRAHCNADQRDLYFRVFQAIDLSSDENTQKPTYAQVAAQLDIPVTQVSNFLHWSRKQFRAVVVDTLRDITASEEEFREEARALLGSSWT